MEQAVPAGKGSMAAAPEKKAYQTGNKDRNRGIYGGGNCCYRRNVRKRTETFKSSKKMLTRDGKAKEK